jgi:hypothetical protein
VGCFQVESTRVVCGHYIVWIVLKGEEEFFAMLHIVLNNGRYVRVGRLEVI